MSNQNAELGKRLRKAIDVVAQKKGIKWALETEAELKATERFIVGGSVDAFTKNETFRNHHITNYDGNLIADDSDVGGGTSGAARITPHDTGNLIAAISNSVKKHGNEYEFSVGVDYTKLNSPRIMYSWYLDRRGLPDRWVKRPGRKTSGAYVKAADRNSDEHPGFLQVWGQRGEANVKRIFR